MVSQITSIGVGTIEWQQYNQQETNCRPVIRAALPLANRSHRALGRGRYSSAIRLQFQACRSIGSIHHRSIDCCDRSHDRANRSIRAGIPASPDRENQVKIDNIKISLNLLHKFTQKIEIEYVSIRWCNLLKQDPSRSQRLPRLNPFK
jgi:hypothetical protein